MPEAWVASGPILDSRRLPIGGARDAQLRERLEELRIDVRLAVRQLISAPGFTSMAALTLALGIGVNSIFALADAALFGRCRLAAPNGS